MPPANYRVERPSAHGGAGARRRHSLRGGFELTPSRHSQSPAARYLADRPVTTASAPPIAEHGRLGRRGCVSLKPPRRGGLPAPSRPCVEWRGSVSTNPARRGGWFRNVVSADRDLRSGTAGASRGSVAREPRADRRPTAIQSFWRSGRRRGSGGCRPWPEDSMGLPR
jgi:hypothetical protein